MQTVGAMLGTTGAGIWPWAMYTPPPYVRALCFLPLRCARADTALKIDSLVQAYACAVADAMRDAFEEVPAWTEHLSENALLKARFDAVFSTAGLDAWTSWCMLAPQCPIHRLCVLYSCTRWPFFRRADGAYA